MEEKTANPNSETTSRMLDRATAGDAAGWDVLVRRFHDRPRRMIAVRLDLRLQGRFDPSDILQETYLDAFRRLPEYLREPRRPFFLWVRYLTAHHLGRIHRDHPGREMRDAGREMSLYQGAMPEASSEAQVALLLGRESRPSALVVRAERMLRLQEDLDRMAPIDRERLAPRHFEHSTRAETARVLNLSETAAAKCHLRAVERRREMLARLPGGPEEFR